MKPTAIETDREHGLWFVTASVRQRPGKSRSAQHLCKCRCGTERWVNAADIANKRSTNCGCVRRSKVAARNLSHGMTDTKEYVVWCGMIARCTNPNHKGYAKYGGRGISVCSRWRDSFESFLEDMGAAPFAGACLDRIDNDGNYEPGNVRWVSNKDNCRNRARVTTFTINGVTKPLNQWAEEYGLRPKTVTQRIRRGVDTMAALTLPLKHLSNPA